MGSTESTSISGQVHGSRARSRRTPGTWGAATTHAIERRYRSKIEVLRDLLEAARQDQCKTRIIGQANLNEESFTRYARYAIDEGLLERREDSTYHATARGELWREAANAVLAKEGELASAFGELSRLIVPSGRLRIVEPRLSLSILGEAEVPRFTPVDVTLERAHRSGGHLLLDPLPPDTGPPMIRPSVGRYSSPPLPGRTSPLARRRRR